MGTASERPAWVDAERKSPEGHVMRGVPRGETTKTHLHSDGSLITNFILCFTLAPRSSTVATLSSVLIPHSRFKSGRAAVEDLNNDVICQKALDARLCTYKLQGWGVEADRCMFLPQRYKRSPLLAPKSKLPWDNRLLSYCFYTTHDSYLFLKTTKSSQVVGHRPPLGLFAY